MSDPEKFKNFLGDEAYYLDFVHFFEGEIQRLGYAAVLQKYLVDEGEVGMDMLPRMYMGEYQLSVSNIAARLT
jgi:hypothetical protein